MELPFFNELLEKGAHWKHEQSILADVSFGECKQQSLDIYFQPGATARTTEIPGPEDLALCASTDTSTTATSTQTDPLPIWIHIHGGGWSRGAKDSKFYGGPGVCRTAVSAGCIAVSVGYRRGAYPAFMEDAANAIRWVRQHMPRLGGDTHKMILSGHSAGGHIASLLLLRHDHFMPDIPKDFLRGVILLSGVYDLFRPMRAAPMDVKNKFFVAAYVMPAFGKDDALRRDASPLLLLDGKKETSLMGSLPRSVRRIWDERRTSSGGARSRSPSEPPEEETPTPSTEEEESESIAKSDIHVNLDLPRMLLMNAAIDMGLQENGELFATALQKHNVRAQHRRIPGTDHASICWKKDAADAMIAFVNEVLFE